MQPDTEAGVAVAMRCGAVRGVRADLAEPLGAGEIDEKKPAPHLLLRVGVHACRSVGCVHTPVPPADVAQEVVSHAAWYRVV